MLAYIQPSRRQIMPQDNRPSDAARKSAASSLRQALSRRNLELSQCGVKVYTENLEPFDPTTGYWANPASVTSKPPRWLFWLERQDGRVVASVPQAPGADRLGYFNTAQGKVSAISVRVVPVIRMLAGDWTFYPSWEWMMFFVMPRPLKAGSSGQVVSNFRPQEGKFGYLYNTDENDPATGRPKQAYEEPAYVAAGLFSLISPNEPFAVQPGVTITYGEATEALQRLIDVSPLDAVTSATLIQAG